MDGFADIVGVRIKIAEFNLVYRVRLHSDSK